MIYFFIGIAGIIGALLRYYIGIVVPNIYLGEFPIATLMINYIGCFVLSGLNSATDTIGRLKTETRTAITMGLIGSFTTFSTFSMDFIKLFQSHHFLLAIIYLILSLLGGYLFTFLGYQIGTRDKKEKG